MRILKVLQLKVAFTWSQLLRKFHPWVWLTQEPIKMLEGDSAAAT